MVHIIPQIRDEGGAKFHHVRFTFDDDLARPSEHAGLPDSFMEDAEICLDWRSKVAIASVWNFRNTWPQLFDFSKNEKVSIHLEKDVWPDCQKAIFNIPIKGDAIQHLSTLAEKMFP